MNADELNAQIEELKEAFGEVAKAATPGRPTLLRFKSVPFPRGCVPTETAALLVLQNGERPKFYVKPGVKLANGAEPRSTSVVQVEGEAWLQFSYTFPWEPASNTLVQFVGASLQRFGKKE